MNIKKFHIVMIGLYAIAVVLFICLLISHMKTDDEVSSVHRAPDGKVYNEWLPSGIMYEPEYWDDFYGHAADNRETHFEEIKPSYYNDIDFSGVVFPDCIDASFYMPAFIMYDAVEYVKIPEDEMRKYLPDERTDSYVDLDENGYEVNGVHFGFIRDEPPIYNYIEPMWVSENRYNVVYHTSRGIKVRNFIVMDGRIVEECRGGQ